MEAPPPGRYTDTDVPVARLGSSEAEASSLSSSMTADKRDCEPTRGGGRSMDDEDDDDGGGGLKVALTVALPGVELPPPTMVVVVISLTEEGSRLMAACNCIS